MVMAIVGGDYGMKDDRIIQVVMTTWTDWYIALSLVLR